MEDFVKEQERIKNLEHILTYDSKYSGSKQNNSYDEIFENCFLGGS